MLQRVRAWDVMRTDLVVVRDAASLRELALSLRQAMKEQPGMACAVVRSDSGEVRGVVTAWWLLLSLEKDFLADPLSSKSGQGDDTLFRTVCRKTFSRRAGDVVERDVPVVAPGDSLQEVLAAMLKTRRRWAVVMEGGKVLGAIAAEDLFLQMDWEGQDG